MRICIPTAGTGSRLGELTRFINKSLVALANRPTICHLIEQCPADAEFVIALGHKGDLVRQFLELAYPERRFYFAEVSPFEGPGSGLGLSLLACREYLQQPFVFMSCDTLVRQALPPLTQNWMAYAEQVAQLGHYRTLQVQDGQTVAVCEKGQGQPGSHFAYIGLAGIVDYAAFWQAMETGGAEAINTGEAHGLRALLAAARPVAAFGCTWYDTGNPAALAAAQAAYAEPGAPNILPKANEAIWFVGDDVIKFSDDQSFIANRALRAQEIGEFVPRLTGLRKNMYSYKNVRGKVLSECVTLPVFEKLLTHCRHFWQPAVLTDAARDTFKASCRKFYRDKSLERIALYYKNFGTQDGAEDINGQPQHTLAHVLQQVDWEWLADGGAGRFHGDFHFENILMSDDGSFTFLDWRQDFGGSLSTGDVYYDLGKLLHGLIICHELIAKDLYEVHSDQSGIHYDFLRKQILVECEQYFMHWLAQHGYEVKKVRVMCALIYLNIAALHHAPYCHLLYALGKNMLAQALAD
ncbi:phosphotransferase [Massilia sp. W12]|uniref:phosphotransferase n=1 Tax=Massilia sp. W12 TaxID=3126507 RepID=UPI0030CCCF31